MIAKLGKPIDTKIFICDPVPREIPPEYFEWKLKTLMNVTRPGTSLVYKGIKSSYFSMPTTSYRHIINAARAHVRVQVLHYR